MDVIPPESAKALASYAKPASQAIRYIAKAIGLAYQPTHIVRMEKAKAKAREIRSTSVSATATLRDRAIQRISTTELRRQASIESIIDRTAKKVRSFSPSVFDADQVRSLFENAQDATRAEVQELWACVLAKELKSPNTFSPRDFHSIKTLAHSEVDLVLTASDLVVCATRHVPPIWMLPRTQREKSLSAFGMTQSDLTLLTQIGVMDDGEANYVGSGEGRFEISRRGRRLQIEIGKASKDAPCITFRQVSQFGQKLFDALDLSERNATGVDSVRKLLGGEITTCR